MKVVIKLGGSVFTKEDFDLEFLKKFSSKIMEWKNTHEIAVVMGGGKLSRAYDSMLRNYTKDEDLLDTMGIYAARVNAYMLIIALGEDACSEIPKSEDEFLELVEKFPGKIIVAGGFRPKQRTDAVSVEVAQTWKAELFIKGTDVDFVYDKDPDKFEDAKPLENVSFEELKKFADQEHEANKPTIMDKVAADMLSKSKIKVAVVNGRDLDNMENALSGKEFKGTKIGF